MFYCKSIKRQSYCIDNMSDREKKIATRRNFTVANKFWRYMQDSDQLLRTRRELRNLYRTNFQPALVDPFEKEVTFGSVMWCFRSRGMGIIEWTPPDNREIIVYRPGQTSSRDGLARDRTHSRENVEENLGQFAEIKKKLVSQRHRLVMANNKGGVTIEPEPDHQGVVHMNATSKLLQLTVANQMYTDVILRCAILGWPGPFKVDDINHIVSESKRARLPGYSRTSFTVTLASSPNPGVYSLPVAFVFHRDEEPEPFHIVKYVRAIIVDEVVTRLRPTRPYRRRRVFASHYGAEIEHGEPPYAEKPDYRVALPSYPIPPNLQRVKTEQLQTLFDAFQGERNCTPERFCEKFSKLLHVEEMQMKVDIQKYQMERATLGEDPPFLTLAVPGLAENRPSLVRGDRLFVMKLAADGTVKEKKQYEGYVHKVTLNTVYLKFSANFHRDFISNSWYRVDFMFSRTTLKIMHRAVQNAAAFLHKIPFNGRPSRASSLCRILRLTKPDIRCYDKKIDGNEEQKQAVINILHGTSKPYPYLVFGPPGTGKTVTIVEAIKQVLQNYPDSKVLACAPSNSAADLILERVAQHNIVPDSQMVRLNAFGRSDTTVKRSILKYCISDGDGFFRLPRKADIERDYRFVVTTLMTAGRLVSLGIPKSHFTHIFIDEAGQGMEPECLVPITGLLEIQGDNPGQLVLAGDPKQLGPVLRSPVAIKYGLGMSFLERLMGPKFECFNRRELLSQKYDPKMVSKLLNNYRSHPKIIELPNEMFYDNELRACADVALRESLCRWSELKKKGFPVIFEAVWGNDDREENSPSFFNPQEVSVVLRYVKQLKEARGIPLETHEIGIISPYHKQVQKIRKELRQRPLKVTDIKVGSVEEFQGQERKVIIISTVRSNVEFLQFDAQHKLGFLKNPKRFNVAITRAQALLVVIGNPDVLCHDQYWRKFIQYCVDNGSFSGGSGSSGGLFEMPEEADQTLAETLQRLSLNENALFEEERDLTGADYEDRPWRSDE